MMKTISFVQYDRPRLTAAILLLRNGNRIALCISPSAFSPSMTSHIPSVEPSSTTMIWSASIALTQAAMDFASLWPATTALVARCRGGSCFLPQTETTVSAMRYLGTSKINVNQNSKAADVGSSDNRNRATASCQDPLCGSGRGVQHYCLCASGRRWNVCNDFNGLENWPAGRGAGTFPSANDASGHLHLAKPLAAQALLARAMGQGCRCCGDPAGSPQYTRWSGGSPCTRTRSTFCQAERNSSAEDWRVTPAMCGVSSSRRAPSPVSVSSGLSATGGSVE